MATTTKNLAGTFGAWRIMVSVPFEHAQLAVNHCSGLGLSPELCSFAGPRIVFRLFLPDDLSGNDQRSAFMKEMEPYHGAIERAVPTKLICPPQSSLEKTDWLPRGMRHEVIVPFLMRAESLLINMLPENRINKVLSLWAAQAISAIDFLEPAQIQITLGEISDRLSGLARNWTESGHNNCAELSLMGYGILKQIELASPPSKT